MIGFLPIVAIKVAAIGRNLTMEKKAALKKLARHLLTTTCLTAAATSVAHAGTINETVDFSNTFGGANALPVGTTEVLGSINPQNDTDFFQFTGLLGGGSYSLAGFYEGSLKVGLLDSANTFLHSLANNPPTFTGTVPGDGILVVEVAGNEQIAAYDLQLTAQSGTPEPSSVAAVATGLAGAWALRRKLKK